MKAYIPSDSLGEWADIPGYCGKYQINRDGDIRRVFKSGKVRDMTTYRKQSKTAKKILRNRLFVKLTKGGKSKEVAVLKVATAAWYGEPPQGMVAYHKNGIVSDNRIDNIGFATRRELGKMTGASSKRKPVKKIDKRGDTLEVYSSARQAAKVNNMSYQTVLDRCHKKVKNEFALDGYTYRFEK